MSMTLNLVERLLAQGSRLHQLGCDHDAFRVLARLAQFEELPADIAEETQACLAEIQLRHGQHAKARKHLAAAIALNPNEGYYHFLLGVAFEHDEEPNLDRAREAYQAAVRLDSDQPEWLGHYGRAAVRLGDEEAGLAALQRAVELEPDDPAVVGRLVDGLTELGRTDEARLVVRAARFRNPRHAGFRKLEADFRFRQARAEQQARRDAAPAASTPPATLPFVRLVGTDRPATGGKRISRHSAHALPRPRRPHSADLTGRKHA